MVGWVLTARLRRRLRRLFPQIYVRGVHYLHPWRNGNATMPLLLYCSHNGWSDIALAAVLSRSVLHLRSRFLLSPQQLQHVPSLRFLGALTVPWDRPPLLQELLPQLLPRLLRSPDTVLWVFATGDFLATGETDIFWSCTDIVRLAQRPLALAPAVWSYQLLLEEPRCYLWLERPEVFTPETAPELVRHCSQRLSELYQQQQQLFYTGSSSSLYQRYRL